MSAKDAIKLAKDKGARIVDLRFIDVPGLWQHFSIPGGELTEELFDEGIGFDGSSIRGFQSIHESDMLLMPDPDTAVMDPFTADPTLVLICDVKDPITGKDDWKPIMFGQQKTPLAMGFFGQPLGGAGFGGAVMAGTGPGGVGNTPISAPIGTPISGAGASDSGNPNDPNNAQNAGGDHRDIHLRKFTSGYATFQKRAELAFVSVPGREMPRSKLAGQAAQLAVADAGAGFVSRHVLDVKTHGCCEPR